MNTSQTQGSQPNMVSSNGEKTCSNCGTKLRPEAKFCYQCGAKLNDVCPECNEPIMPGARFCQKCGKQLNVM